MKKISFTIIVGAIIFTLSSCGQIKDSKDVSIDAGNSAMEIDNSASEVWEIQNVQNDDIVSSDITESAEGFNEEEQTVSKETGIDLYEGEFSDYDVNEPSLEIKRNDDETYQVQIEIYRMWYFDDGIGKATEEGLEFVATGPSGKEIKGVIKLEEDAAIVTFLSQEWVDFAGLEVYKFYKISDVPNIHTF